MLFQIPTFLKHHLINGPGSKRRRNAAETSRETKRDWGKKKVRRGFVFEERLFGIGNPHLLVNTRHRDTAELKGRKRGHGKKG